jgi:hypothetical protein
VNLLIDDHYKWDSTFHMLVAACELMVCLDEKGKLKERKWEERMLKERK